MDSTFSRWRPHPWHGLSPGPSPPSVVHAFVEITPFDLVKYEVDKATGYLKVDRAQRTSSLPPTLYGFIPQTYAGSSVASLMAGATIGDHDPQLSEISDVPPALVERLSHYFSTYKLPRSGASPVSVGEPYGRTHAESVVAAAIEDYRGEFGRVDGLTG